jgi:hypothetical protein
MAHEFKECGPDFPGSQYERGPSDKNPSMFDFEKKMADAIERRCGPATPPQPSYVKDVGMDPSGPGRGAV